MPTYRFNLIINCQIESDEDLLDIADKLAESGCLDASVCGHREGVEVAFDREAESLQAALQSAVKAVIDAGFQVLRVEMEPAELLQD